MGWRGELPVCGPWTIHLKCDILPSLFFINIYLSRGENVERRRTKRKCEILGKKKEVNGKFRGYLLALP
jgi:hypothetical protein